MTSFLDDINERLQRIGTEALAVRTLELSMIAQLAAAPMSDEDRAEWEELLRERREYVAGRIDEVMALLHIHPIDTLEALRLERARRARR
ncbi:hypothetical protein [Burkholderia cenocepacia]|uniref:hypothetical protein n=1 Tax=Burkholderia cenocepacia TaxID=95486 RepID=UPI001906FD7A|nr:hypothetical protein [Burkholderia cenocepacia]MBJ9895248.1 hypothetical protein [Burkholderia cenocepacia]MBJ9917648.1 hypothetical protein [Burkholderia cenocepacia]